MNTKLSTAVIAAIACLYAGAGGSDEIRLSTSGDDGCDATLSSISFNGDQVVANVSDLGTCAASSVAGGVSLEANPTNILADDTKQTTLGWSIPEGYTCSLTRNGSALSNINYPSGAATVGVVTGNNTFKMSCAQTKTTGGMNEAAASALVSVEGDTGGGGGEPVGTECTQNLSGYTRVDPAKYRDGSVTVRDASTFEELFGVWGTFNSNVRNPTMGSFKYISMPFIIGAENDGQSRMIWEQLPGSPDNIRMSVSTCYGAPMQETAVAQTGSTKSCYVQGSGKSGKFTMTTDPNAAFGCILEPGQQYFLNLAFADAAGGSGCARTTCEFLVVQQ